MSAQGERKCDGRSFFLCRVLSFNLSPRCRAAVHVYLAVGQLGELAAGHLIWTHVWKGFGALTGAYVFAALASRRMSTGRQSSAAEDRKIPILTEFDTFR